MENNYVEAKQVCLNELREFYEDINDFLPDEDGSYFMPWTMEVVLYVQRRLNKAIDIILSTCMRYHIAYEMDIIQKDMSKAIKHKDIDNAKMVLNNAMCQFIGVCRACEAIKGR